MNKHELSKELADKTDTRLFESYHFIDLLVEAFTESLKRGEKIVISNFGTFYIKDRRPKRVRNPQTGQMMTIPAGKAVKFKAARNFKIE
jgi:DNA-binding protein HU-beta